LDKAIITTFMLIAGVITAVLVFNVVYPAAVQGSDALTKMESRIDDRMQSQIEIVHASGQSTDSDVYVWVKNVGSVRVAAIERVDVFFGPEGNFARIPYNTGSPHWEYELENDSAWNPSATLKILIRYGAETPPAGRHFLKVVLSNGISDEYFFSID
jgi:archaellum component FlaF (FlaF/FlaG flagellin family)